MILQIQESLEYITVEHIMYCLLEDEYINEICKDLKVDINNIKEDLDQYIKNEQLNGLVGVNGTKAPKKTTGVERIYKNHCTGSICRQRYNNS